MSRHIDMRLEHNQYGEDLKFQKVWEVAQAKPGKLIWNEQQPQDFKS